MNRSRPSKSQRNRSAWAAGASVLFAASIVFLGWLKWAGSKAPSPAAPILRLDFADGVRMEVLGLGAGTFNHREGAVVKRWWTHQSSSQSIHDHGEFHGGGVRTTVGEENGVGEWSASQSDADPLLIGVKLHEPSGVPFRIGRCFSLSALHVDRRFGAPRGDGLRVVGTLTGPDEQTIAAHLRSNDVAFHVQHLDPDSGWTSLSGPVWIGEELPEHHLLALSVWRRDLKTLKFRVIRDSGEVVEFDLPAPPAPAVRRITPEPLPVTRLGMDYTVRLDAIEIRENSCLPPSIHAAPVLESARYLIGHGLSDHLAGQLIGVRDEAGNLDPFEVWDHGEPGGYFQRNSRRVELIYQVSRKESFPMPEASCLMIAEGVVSPDGGMVAFTLLPDAVQIGLQPILPAPVKRGTLWAGAESRQVVVRIEGKLGDTGLPARFSGLSPGQLRLVVFRENEAESSGQPWFTRGGSGGARLRQEVTWNTPHAAVSPGKRIRLALAPPLKPDLHVFPIEIPAGSVAK